MFHRFSIRILSNRNKSFLSVSFPCVTLAFIVGLSARILYTVSNELDSIMDSCIIHHAAYREAKR